MPQVTVETLRERLGWSDIREEALPEYEMRLFRAIPRDESLPSVYFLFDDEVELLDQLGSGDWHYHPDDTEEAIDLARKLIHHEMCILEERDRNGRGGGSGPVGPDDVLRTLRLDADHFVRHFFGVSGKREAIDFSRYVKGKHLYVEVKYNAESDAAWESLGRPPQEF